MRIKLTLDRPGSAATDLLVTADVQATIGDLAAYLDRADPVPGGRGPARREPDPPTLRVVDPDQADLDPKTAVGDSGLRSGMTVRITRFAGTRSAARTRPVATVRVMSGPDAGAQIELPAGEGLVGRDATCEVRLNDRLVSRRHARFVVGRHIEVVDLGSANGVQVGGVTVSRAVLRSGDVVQVGDTELSVEMSRPAIEEPAEGAAVGFIRSPRLDAWFEGERFTAPEPPRRPGRTRFPVIALLTPVLMGGVLFLITGSATSVAFVALSPLMAIGQVVESKTSGKAEFKRAAQEFRAQTEALTTRMRAAAETEAAVRGQEHPALAACLDALWHRTPLLWSRRPDGPGFAELRLGTGRLPSRSTVELPPGRGLSTDLIAELQTAIQPFGQVEPVPVVAGLGTAGALGLAGRRQILLAAARALVLQAALLHSPAELVVAAFASRESAAAWDWLKWLPHTGSPHSPLPRLHLASGTDDTTGLISALEELVRERSAKTAPLLPAVLVIVEPDGPAERSRLVELAERGRAHGVHVLWLADGADRLPSVCRTFLTVDPSSSESQATGIGTVGFAETGERVESVVVEFLDEQTAGRAARQLAPLVDVGARVEDDSDLPRGLSLLTVSGGPMTVSADGVIDTWLANRSLLSGPYAPAKPVLKPGTLRAVIGVSATGPHVLDLRADGPHALIGGTTGSGKSELLQSWILAMAAAHSPERLTFLLVDYKGGSALSSFTKLPHTVGMVTDLDAHLADRALVSLAAELRHREHLLAEHKAKDLIDLEKRGSRGAPPSLVIVIDEFAALIKELPGFVGGMIDVAQRGRSLGVHLILATQRPAGAINDNLRANTNLRLALRTADEDDSVNVLGSPEAAYFDPGLPGRAVSKTGPGRLVRFQTGYAGGWTTDEPDPPEISVAELGFGSLPVWEVKEADQEAEVRPTDLSRLVGAIAEAGVKARLAAPRKPWLPELADVCDLTDPGQVANPRRDDMLVFGVADRPRQQDRIPVAFEPDRHGSLAVIGTGGSGKSTLLRTVAVAAGLAARGGPCQVYGLDFGARGLAMLDELPHVGGVIAGTDGERVTRLLRRLLDDVTERAARYDKAEAGTIAEYRANAGRPDEPRILLLVDGMANFLNSHDIGSPGFEALCRIAGEGRRVGVHALVTADRNQSIPAALAAVTQARVVLRLADQDAYSQHGVLPNVLSASSPPGRGLFQGLEIQVAIPGPDPDLTAQAAEIRNLAGAMAGRGVGKAPAVEKLPEVIPMDLLPGVLHDLPVIGRRFDTLDVFAVEPAGSFLIAGPPQSGRTTAVHTLATALERWRPQIRRYRFGISRSPLAESAMWTDEALDADEAVHLADRLVKLLEDDPAERPVSVFVESAADFANGPAEPAMIAMARRCLARGHFLVVEGESSTLASGSTTSLIGLAKSRQTGLALTPDSSSNDAGLFRTTFPRGLSRSDFPPGRALHIAAGRTVVVQIGSVDG